MPPCTPTLAGIAVLASHRHHLATVPVPGTRGGLSTVAPLTADAGRGRGRSGLRHCTGGNESRREVAEALFVLPHLQADVPLVEGLAARRREGDRHRTKPQQPGHPFLHAHRLGLLAGCRDALSRGGRSAMPCISEPGNPTPRGGRGKEIARQSFGPVPGRERQPCGSCGRCAAGRLDAPSLDSGRKITGPRPRSPRRGRSPEKIDPPREMIKEGTGAEHHRIDVDPGRWPGIGTPDTADQRRHPTTETRR
jgi:hypothetical protein